jgi:hypothetical protein
MTGCQSVSMFWCLVHSVLEGLYSNEFLLDETFNVTVRRAACEACSATWNHRNICSGTKKNRGKTWLTWLLAGTYRCKLTVSQQSGIKYASPNINPYPCCSFFSFSFDFYFSLKTSCFYKKKYGYTIWMSTKPCTIPAEEWMHICTNMLTNIHISVSVILLLLINLCIYCSL